MGSPRATTTRRRMIRAADAIGLGGPLRTLRGRLQPDHVRRDRADHARLLDLLAAELAPCACCVDVGAHEGAVLAEIVRRAPDGRHVAYEPIPALAQRLMDAYPQVDVRAAALSDREGHARFAHVPTLPGWSGFRARRYPGEHEVEWIEVPVERLDAALPEGYVPALIKIDVEGAEREVLAGALETIRRHRPLVVFEHGLGSADYYGTTPADIHELLCERAGLRIFGLDGDGPYPRDRLERIYAAGERVNFVARP